MASGVSSLASSDSSVSSWGGGGGANGGEGGEGGEGGGEGGERATTKVALPVPPPSRPKLWSVHSGAVLSAPFHPSSYQSYMLSVQVPGGTACVAE